MNIAFYLKIKIYSSIFYKCYNNMKDFFLKDVRTHKDLWYIIKETLNNLFLSVRNFEFRLLQSNSSVTENKWYASFNDIIFYCGNDKRHWRRYSSTSYHLYSKTPILLKLNVVLYSFLLKILQYLKFNFSPLNLISLIN